MSPAPNSGAGSVRERALDCYPFAFTDINPYIHTKSIPSTSDTSDNPLFLGNLAFDDLGGGKRYKKANERFTRKSVDHPQTFI